VPEGPVIPPRFPENIGRLAALLGMASQPWFVRLFAHLFPRTFAVGQEPGCGALPEVLVTRPCCDEEACVRKDIAHLLDPEYSIEDRICTAASAVALTCGNLNPAELRYCAARLLDVPPECELANTFVMAYQTERDALDGKRDLENRRAAGRS